MNAGGDGGDVRFQVGGGDSAGNCSSSVVDGCLNPMSLDVSVMAMSSMSTGKPLNLADPFFSSAWDPLFPLSHNETIGSSLVSHGEFVNMPYPMTNLDNQGVGRNCTAQLARYAFDSRLLHLGSGSFSDVIGSFGVPELNQMAHSRSLLNNSISNLNGEPDETVLAKGTQSRENRSSEDEAPGSAPINRRRKRSPQPSSPYDPNKKIERENSDVPKTPDEKKQKIEEAESTKFAKPNTRQSKDDSSNGGEAAKENYIHVRARRGQATNSHSLAERVRREKISERMKMLQELVPGCNKITGKAVMLDEIINYVQSLQQQVEFLSMKLATLIPGLSIDVEKALSKETLYSHGGGPTNLGPHSGVTPSQLYSLGNFRGTLPILPSTSQCPLNQSPLDGELQTLYEMGFDSISGRLKLEQ